MIHDIVLFKIFSQDKNVTDVSKEDFLLAMEVNIVINIIVNNQNIFWMQIIFRLYDEDGNSVVTKKEIDQISQIITQPEFAARFEGGVINIIKEVESVETEKYVYSSTLGLNLMSNKFHFIAGLWEGWTWRNF